MLRIGCIADDFTGGSDIASFFVKGGLSTVLYNGIPEENMDSDADVCVIALKTRTQETKSAVEDSLEAIRWLRKNGAQQFYVKYCSTFDSTPEGNIGPICDAVMEELDVPYTILCPALPVNGRTVKNGHLYVHGVPLHESPMKDHPLTPMWDSDLVELMNAQSKYPSVKLPDVSGDADVEQFVAETSAELDADRFYMVPDYERDEDAEQLVQLLGGLTLITGGSGLAEPLAQKYEKSQENQNFTSIKAPALILSGSCSEATRNQVAEYEKSGGASYFMNPVKLLSGEDSVDNIWKYVTDHKDKSVLVYSSDKPENVRQMQQEHGKEAVAETLEKATAELASRAVEAGYHRLIVAGGETSGAVTKKLGYSSYHIGQSVAPGVPVMIPTQDTRIRLVLKSGNFGEADFFHRALSLT
jgi:uncharacterized protein YgbK (DUF1537 family)